MNQQQFIILESIKKIQADIFQLIKNKKEKKLLISFCKSFKTDVIRNKLNIDEIPQSDKFHNKLQKLQINYSKLFKK